MNRLVVWLAGRRTGELIRMGAGLGMLPAKAEGSAYSHPFEARQRLR